MKIRNIKITKSARFLVLLLLSLLIGVANAAIFYSMIMQPVVSVTAAKVVFVQGTDGGGGVATPGTNSTSVSLALKAYPNITLTYEQPLNISNTDTTSHTFKLRHISITPANGSSTVGNFTCINFVVQDTAGVAQGSFNYTTNALNWITPATIGPLNLPASTQWIIYVETGAVAGASDAATATIQIAVDVT